MMSQKSRNIYKGIATLIIVFSISLSSGQDLILDVRYENTPEPNGISLPEEYYEGGRVRNVSSAQIYVYLPEKTENTKAAILICPGGGYTHESLENEGHKYARFLQEQGIAGVVLKYRLPNGHPEIPMLDAKNAMRMIRANAEKWDIDTTKVGISGFSAGGHLASTIGTHFDKGNRNATKEFAKFSCRPDFMVLIYPLINIQPGVGRSGSRNALLGEGYGEKDIEFFQNQKHVSSDTPPAFLCLADDDQAVIPENSIMFYKALKTFDIPSELHIFSKGGHGFGMKKQDLPVDNWTSLMIDWLRTMGIISQKTISESWKTAEQILMRLKPPSFPDTIYKVTDFGAVGDGSAVNTKPINKAISVCSENGGGIVLITAGIYKTGAIHLQDNVNLKLSKGAELQFSVNPEDYLPLVETSWEGIRCYNYSPFIYAVDKTNVAISGKGVLNGMASNENWWQWKGMSNFGWKEGNPSQRDEQARSLLESFNSGRTPLKDRVLGPGHFLRPQFIQFYRCSNVLIEGVTIKNSPFWVIHPVFSNNVTIRELTVHSLGPNNDGCDPESCKDVLIEDCVFDTGDDCVALKSGRNEDGREINIPIENVIIRNCRMKNGHGGVVIGSEISGGAKNIFAEECHMDSPQLERAIRIKTNTHRGGLVENIYVRNIKIGEVEESVIRINCKYNPEEGKGSHLPLVSNIHISGIKSKKAKYALWMTGLEAGNTIKDIHLEDCKFLGVARPSIIENVTNLSLKGVFMNGEIVNVQ